MSRDAADGGRLTRAIPTLDCLDHALAVIRAAALLRGSLKEATAWFFDDPISLFDGATAEALVQQGRTHDVLCYVESLDDGFAG